MEQVDTSLDALLRILPFLIPIILLQLILMVAGLVDISRREEVRYLPKWAWVLIVIFFQMIGPIAYFIIGRKE